MTEYIGKCQRCGTEFGDEPRNKLSMMREYARGAGFGTGGFARYYCDECAEEIVEAVRRHEKGGAE